MAIYTAFLKHASYDSKEFVEPVSVYLLKIRTRSLKYKSNSCPHCRKLKTLNHYLASLIPFSNTELYRHKLRRIGK